VIGREAEVSALDGFVGSIGKGFAVLALEGEPGIGKTTVWQQGVDLARVLGYTVLACRPAQAEARMSFVGLVDLLGSVPDDTLAALPEPQRVALELVLLRARGDGLRPKRATVSVAVLSLLRALAVERGKVLMAVDDAQWLDPPSAAVLEFAARRLDREQIRVLTSVRLSDEPTGTFDMSAGERRQVLRILPLNVGSMHELLKERLGRVFARPTLIKVTRMSAGNPFYALEVARALVSEGEPRTGDPLPVPEDLGKLVRARIRRLPCESQEELLIASVLSSPTLDVVDAASLAAAERADIVRVGRDQRIEFTHPLFASAVYSSASAADRRAVHRRLAERLEDVEERARHLALAADRPDEHIAEALERGAVRARSRGAWESAAELYERARMLTPVARTDAAQRRGVLAAEHHVHAGDRARARRLLETLLAEDLTRSLRCEALRLLAEISFHDEHFAEAERLFAEALERAEAPRVAATIECALAYVRSQLNDPQGAGVHACRAVALAEAGGDTGVLGLALAYCAMFDFLCGRRVDWRAVERSLKLEDAERIVPLHLRPSAVVACLVLYVGRLRDARRRLEAVRAAAMERGDESDLPVFLLWLSWLETLAGDFRRAAVVAEEGLTVASLTGSESMRVWVLTQRAFVHAHRGDVDETRQDCARAIELDTFGHALTGQWIAASLGLLELSLGNPRSAWEACEAMTEPLEVHGFTEPVPHFFLPIAVEALIELGQLDRAEHLTDSLEARGRELGRAWALATGGRCRGVLQAARGDLAGAEAAFDRALAEHERLGMPFERARTMLCLGKVQRRGKQRKAARETLAQALSVFDALGAATWAAKARAELDRTHVRQASQQLTPSEEQVVQLAAAGMRNRDIAERLFISPKTVEANLARAYRKLGVRTRAELGAAIAVREAATNS
jgi:DNA-binding CsgD family transcriptional regulator